MATQLDDVRWLHSSERERALRRAKQVTASMREMLDVVLRDLERNGDTTHLSALANQLSDLHGFCAVLDVLRDLGGLLAARPESGK